MTDVACVLLDEVDEDPAQSHLLAAAPVLVEAGHGGVGTVCGDEAVDDPTRALDTVLPQLPQCFCVRGSGEVPVRVLVRVPVGGSPRFGHLAADAEADPEVFDERQVGEHAAQCHRGRGDGGAQLVYVEAADLPGARLPVEVDVARDGFVLVRGEGRVGATCRVFRGGASVFLGGGGVEPRRVVSRTGARPFRSDVDAATV